MEGKESMATNNWVGATKGTSNFWNDPADWSKGVPANSSDVTIAAPGTYSVVITAADRPYLVKTLHLGGSSGTTRLIENGSLSVSGVANLTHSIFDIGAGGTGSVIGNLTVSAGSTVSAEGVLNVGGTLAGNGGVEVDGGSMFAGSISGPDVVISLGGTIEVGGKITPASSIKFADDGTNALLLDAPDANLRAKISGFSGQNKLDLASLPFSSQYTTHYNGTTLTITAGDTPVFSIANINNPGSFALADDGGGGTDLMGCYAQGTMIGTPDGEVPVEALKPGEPVVTLAGGKPMPVPVVWVGYRRLDLTAHPHPLMVAPVRIERGAFADKVPHRDLLVSPDHAILTDGVLICARQLVNGATIRQESDHRSIVYYHVELENHAIMLAEGVPAESYLDTGNRGFFANSVLPCALHPDLTSEADYPIRVAKSCEPFVTDEVIIRPIWKRLAERAAALGHELTEPQTTNDPQLRLIAENRSIKPINVEPNVYIFVLPPRAKEVRLVSRAAAPCITRPWLDDRRCLGVQVARLVVRCADQVALVPLDHPSLVTGWWDVEREGVVMRRWTDGDAALSLPATSGASMLEVRIVGTVPYSAEPEIALAS
jgi:hypothetical protein